METLWLRYLNRLDLSVSAERDHLRYVVRDGRDGKLYLTEAETAEALAGVQAHLRQPGGTPPSKDMLSRAFQFTEQIRRMGTAAGEAVQPLNPLFLRWEAIDLGRFDGPLRRAALWAVPVFLTAMMAGLLLTLWVGMQTGWTILSAGAAQVSPAGLALFAALTPMLKLPHELGHALTARFFGVRLGRAGVILVGLLPLPFVDCSLADVDASRRQRVLISLAGIVVDLFLAMLAFLMWHVSTGDLARTLWLNIFVFSSINSVLFNGNPLIRLDGYYAFSDAIGQRNLSTRGAQRFKALRQWVTSLGAAGERPAGRQWAVAAFGLGAGIYKIYVLALVIWVVLPKGFGLGAALVVWGGAVMFATPLLRPAPDGPAPTGVPGRRALFWLLLAGGLSALAFVPLPLREVVDLRLDTEGTYALRLEEPGRLQDHAPGASVAEGAFLASLTSLPLTEAETVLARQRETAELAYAAAAGRDPAEAQALNERRARLSQQAEGLSARRARLDLRAGPPGLFVPRPDLLQGQYLREGASLGYLLPDAGAATLVGQLPERLVEDFRDGPVEIRLWTASEGPLEARPEQVALDFIQSLDVELGTRRYQLTVTLDRAPSSLSGQMVQARIDFGTRPVHVFAARLWSRVQTAYREARLAQMR